MVKKSSGLDPTGCYSLCSFEHVCHRFQWHFLLDYNFNSLKRLRIQITKHLKEDACNYRKSEV